jgi:uncharacterized protein YkwD
MRAKIIRTLGAALLVAVLFPLHRGWNEPPVFSPAFAAGPGFPGIQPLPEVELEIGRLTNETRRQHGLPPLTADLSLVDAARQHSSDMLARRFFSHQNPEGRSFMERLPPAYGARISRSGENIWTGSGYYPFNPQNLARMIMDSWISSPGHCKNILTPGFTHLGVGVAAWGREVRATQVFVGMR